MSLPHLSVLLDEVVQSFDGIRIDTFVDATLGAGGHALAILTAHPEIRRFVGIDQDRHALQIAQERLKAFDNKVTFVHANFSALEQQNLSDCDGILLDLGVSSMQLDTAERGFSISNPGPLDMRMNNDRSLTAAEIVNTWSERDLGRILRDYGEEKRWRAAARTIIQAREKAPILTTQALVDLLDPVLRDPRSRKAIHPLTLVFQGLRIAVNAELEVLEQALQAALTLLRPGGRLAVISFHSLEDRIVKQQMAYWASDKEDTHGIAGVFRDKKPSVRILTRKPVMPTAEESAANPRARSAKLRVVEKLPC